MPTVPPRLVIGMFTLHPAGQFIAAGQSQTISVDCVAESLGKIEEVCNISVTIESLPTSEFSSEPDYVL